MRNRTLIVALVALAAVNVSAETHIKLDLGGGRAIAKAETRIEGWLKRRDLRKELELVAARADFLATNETGELRDSLASATSDKPASVRLAQTRAVNSGMPPAFWSLTAPRPETCLSLSDCATPALAMDVEKAEDIPAAVTTLLRPWLLIQHAAKSSLRLEADGRTDGRLLSMRIPGLPNGPAAMRLAAKPDGKGFRVWFEDGLVLAAFYELRRVPLL